MENFTVSMSEKESIALDAMHDVEFDYNNYPDLDYEECDCCECNNDELPW